MRSRALGGHDPRRPRARAAGVGFSVAAVMLWACCGFSFEATASGTFTEPGHASAPRVGDRLGFEVVVQRGRDTHRRTVHLEAIAVDLAPDVPIPESVRLGERGGKIPDRTPATMKGGWSAERPPKSWVLVRVESEEEKSSRSHRSYGFLPADLTDVGFFEFASLAAGPEEDRPRSAEDVRAQERLKRSLEGLIALTGVLSENEPLREILVEARKATFLQPSFSSKASVIFGKGFTIFYEIRESEVALSTPIVPVVDGEGMFELTVKVRADETKLGAFTLRVVRPRTPYSLAAGIVGISAAHLEDPKRVVTIRLTEASRSSP